MRKNDGPIIVEQTFHTSIDTVWNSITKIDHMRQWYFKNIPSFKPEVGFATQFNVQSHDRNFLHMWTVTEVVPLKKITYNWTSRKFYEFSRCGGCSKGVSPLQGLQRNNPSWRRIVKRHRTGEVLWRS